MLLQPSHQELDETCKSIVLTAPRIVETSLTENLRNKGPAKRPLISTQDSAAGLVTLIANLTAANQDAVFNYNGDKFSW